VSRLRNQNSAIFTPKGLAYRRTSRKLQFGIARQRNRGIRTHNRSLGYLTFQGGESL